MSFDLVTSYKRPLLRPLVFPTHVVSRSPLNPDSNDSPQQSWHASTHTFVGTGDRDESTAWPPARFDHDPANIPDDVVHDIPYDAATAEEKEGHFRLYSDVDVPAGNAPSPRIAVKRYIPKSRADHHGRGITLLMLTGMGAVKEMFEPMLEELLPQLRESGVKVEEVWALDMPFCGETAQVNPMGYLYTNEKDITRDLMFFITAYLPIQPGSNLPSELEARRPTSSPKQPTRQDLHVVAHSLGAQAAILASVHAPDIFSSLTVADPAMIPSGKINNAMAKLPKDVLCLGIAERYSDKAAVEKELAINKRTRGWDHRVKRIFAQYGVVPDELAAGPEAVRLAARPRLEWALYYDKQTPAQCYDRLADIGVPFHAIMPGRPFAVPPKMFEADVAKMSQRTSIRWLQGTTHQVLFERLDASTGYVADWLAGVAVRTKAHL